MRILERLAILSAMALCVLAGEVAADGPVSFDREFVYEEGQTIAQAYRTWRFDIDEAGVYALDIVPGTRPVTAFLDGAQIAFTRAGNDNKGKIDKEGRIRRTRWLAPGSHIFDLHVTMGHVHNDKMEEAMCGNEKVPGVRAGVSKLREGEAGFWIEGRDPDCMARVAGEPLVVAGCAVGNSRKFTMEVSDGWSQALAVGDKPVRFEYPCDKEGAFTYQIKNESGEVVEGPWDFVVTDISHKEHKGHKENVKLIDTVDCTEGAGGAHLFREGGKSEIVEAPDGAYRLTGPAGIHKNGGHRAFDWFGYTLKVEHPGRTHVLSVRVPNDIHRLTFVAAFDRRVMRCNIWGIVTGDAPAAGPLSELKIPVWPNGNAIDVMVMNTDGARNSHVSIANRRGAAASMALYEYPDGLAPLPPPSCGWNATRGFGWDGEQVNLGPNERTMPPLPDDSASRMWEKMKSQARHEWSDIQKTWDRTFELEAWRGGTVVCYPVYSYNMQLYQGRSQLLLKPGNDIYAGMFVDSVRDPVDRDVFALILQCAEKHGVTVVADFMVQGMSYIHEKWAAAFSRRFGFGGDITGMLLSETADGKPVAHVNGCSLTNPAHPVVRRAQVEFCREFGRCYGRYKSFGGIRHRFWPKWPASMEPWFRNENTGFDDFTVGEFSKSTGIPFEPVGTNEAAFAARKKDILEKHGAEWTAWRAEVCRSLHAEMLAALREGAPQARFHVAKPPEWFDAGSGLDPAVFAKEHDFGFDADQVYLLGPGLELNGLDPEFFGPFFIGRKTIPPFSLCCNNSSVCAPYNLEPAAQALSSNRLDMIWSGGQWSLPPLDDTLREFVRAYRAIPDRTDWRKAAAGDTTPVSVWWAKEGEDVIFWAVNCTDTKRKVVLTFDKEAAALEDMVSGESLTQSPQSSQSVETKLKTSREINLPPFMPGVYRARGVSELVSFETPVSEEEKSAIMRELEHLRSIARIAEGVREPVAGGGEEYCPDAGAFSRRDISLSLSDAAAAVAEAERVGDVLRLGKALKEFRAERGWWYRAFGRPAGLPFVPPQVAGRTPLPENLGVPEKPNAPFVKVANPEATEIAVLPQSRTPFVTARKGVPLALRYYNRNLPHGKLTLEVVGLFGGGYSDIKIENEKGELLGVINAECSQISNVPRLESRILPVPLPYRNDLELRLVGMGDKGLALSHAGFIRMPPRPVTKWEVAGPFGCEKIDMKYGNNKTRREYAKAFPPECDPKSPDAASVEWKMVALGDGERVVDLAKAVPCDFRNETCVAFLRVVVKSPSTQMVTMYWVNDYFGLIRVNGSEVAKMNGPSNKYASMQVELRKGGNVILVRTMAGTGSCWHCGLAFDDDGSLGYE